MANDGLLGRRAECEALDHLLADVRAGRSRVLVLHGEPGVGKTALLDYVGRQASGCRVISVAGVESELELAYAALQQLCAPLLDRIDRLPPPQGGALKTALGLGDGPVPDRLLVGLAVLGLFADAATGRPLVFLVDDLHWLDEASASVLTFVARRLAGESVALVMAARVVQTGIGQLPTMEVNGLKNADAHALLESALVGPLDANVREQLVAETRGNPLALLELPNGLSVQELAGGFGVPGAIRLSAAVEERFRRVAEALPEDSRLLLLLAAAEPLGDPALLWRAAEVLGIDADTATPVMEAGLADFGVRVTFRHPLVRSAAYGSAPLAARQRVHAALGGVIDVHIEPDRRAWHLARATPGQDDGVADELERSAARAAARGGLLATAAFLERATSLTRDPARRAKRALDAATAKLEAGAFDSAVELLGLAARGPLDDLGLAHVELLRSQLKYMTDRGRESPALLLSAATKLETLDPARSVTTYLEAFSAGMFAGRFAEGSRSAIAHAARVFRRPSATDTSGLLLDAFTALYGDGAANSVPKLRRAVASARADTSPDIRSTWLAHVAAVQLWDGESADILAVRRLMLARSSGALGGLPAALNSLIVWSTFKGEFMEIDSLIKEFKLVSESTGGDLAPHGEVIYSAFRGDRPDAEVLISTTEADVTRRGEGVGLTICEYARAVLANGSGEYAAAMTAVRDAAEKPSDIGVSGWAIVELVEAAARCGAEDVAMHATNTLSELTTASGTDWAMGVEARARALLSQGPEADQLYREAIERLNTTEMRAEHARAHLLYGEWLRRERRRTEARTHLRTAHEMFNRMRMQAFAERAGRELHATGEVIRTRAANGGSDQLTAQETQVARLARDGVSNIDIAARLFVSPRTVQYHLRKVYAKLGIRSRTQLHQVLPSDRD